MTTPTAPALLTADEFLDCDHGGFELIDGVLEENPMGSVSSWLGGEIFAILHTFIRTSALGGVVLPQETGIRAWPDRPRLVRKPDAMFIRRDRLPGGKLAPGWLEVAPDLAVEVVSPHDTVQNLDRKLADYRAAAIPLVWVINPDTRTAYVYAGDRVTLVPADGVLDGGDVLPGFSLPLADLFAAAGDLI